MKSLTVNNKLKNAHINKKTNLKKIINFPNTVTKNTMSNDEMKKTMKHPVLEIYLLESRNYMRIEDL